MEPKKLSNKLLKEIALVALTYRTSYKTLAKILNTTEDDVSQAFLYLSDLSDALYYLNQETLNENEIAEKEAYFKTKNYFSKRTKLYSKLNNPNYTRQEVLEEINDLVSEINDHEVSIIMNKNYRKLTEADYEAIARFRLKYYYSIRAITRNFKISKEKINKVETELAKKDPIYSDKLDLLHYVCDKQRDKFSREYSAGIRR